MTLPVLFRKAACLFILLMGIHSHAAAQPTEIRCRTSGITEAYLIWGINDWQPYKKKIPGTVMEGGTMRTAMKKEGEEYVARLDISSGKTINYGFLFNKKTGPFGKIASYWDMNENAGGKGYIIASGGKEKALKIVDTNKLEMRGRLSLTSLGLGLMLVFGLGALALFVLRKYNVKKIGPADGKAAYFAGLSAAFFCALFFIRAQTAGLLYAFLLEPLNALAEMFAAAWGDIKYAGILFGFFGLLFLLFKKAGKFVLVLYTLFVFLSVVASLANIQVLQLLGRPFNYQWLYYSDFLQSTDASLAMAASVSMPFVSGFLLMLLAAIAMFCFFKQVYLQRRFAILLLLPLLFIACLLAHPGNKVPPLKAANPVLFFIESVMNADALPAIDKSHAGKSDFDKKNIDSLPAAYAALFKQNKIKNVVFVVLESTPWEYVAPYDTVFGATPFLHSIKSNAAVFGNVYAHIPSTNKSMFSFLCGACPEISFKSLTVENPAINFPSIPSELKKHGYRTAFFNSGDNRYQNAEGFLKSRGFDSISDFRNGRCGIKAFHDKRYSKENLDGVDDSCLSAKLFDWIGTDTAQPFFAMLWTFQTHYPYFTGGAEKNYYTGNPLLEKYLNALQRADEAIKQIADGLKERGLLEQTLIVVCGDHGEAFGRHNQTAHASAIYEENLHVPLLFINPLLFTGQRLDNIGAISDIAPTIFSVLGKAAPNEWQGENLFSDNRRKRAYFFNPYAGYLFGMREGQYKFIYNAAQNTSQLYNLSTDPHETTDISKENEAYVKEATGRVHAWMYYQAKHFDNIAKTKTAK